MMKFFDSRSRKGIDFGRKIHCRRKAPPAAYTYASAATLNYFATPLKLNRYEYFMRGTRGVLSLTRTKLNKLNKARGLSRSRDTKRSFGTCSSAQNFGTRTATELRVIQRYIAQRNSSSKRLRKRKKAPEKWLTDVRADTRQIFGAANLRRNRTQGYSSVEVGVRNFSPKRLSKRKRPSSKSLADEREATRQVFGAVRPSTNERAPRNLQVSVGNWRATDSRDIQQIIASHKPAQRYIETDRAKNSTDRLQSIGSHRRSHRTATYRGVSLRKHRKDILSIVSFNRFNRKHRFVDVCLFYIKQFVDVQKSELKKTSFDKSHFGGVRKNSSKSYSSTKLQFGRVRIKAFQITFIKIRETRITGNSNFELEVWNAARSFAWLFNLGILAWKVHGNICSKRLHKHNWLNIIPGHFYTCSYKSDTKSILNPLLKAEGGTRFQISASLAQRRSRRKIVQFSVQSRLHPSNFDSKKSSCVVADNVREITRDDCDVERNNCCDVTDRNDCGVRKSNCDANLVTLRPQRVGAVSESINARIIHNYEKSSRRKDSLALRAFNFGLIELSVNELTFRLLKSVSKEGDYSGREVAKQFNSQQRGVGSIKKRVCDHANTIGLREVNWLEQRQHNGLQQRPSERAKATAGRKPFKLPSRVYQQPESPVGSKPLKLPRRVSTGFQQNKETPGQKTSQNPTNSCCVYHQAKDKAGLKFSKPPNCVLTDRRVRQQAKERAEQKTLNWSRTIATNRCVHRQASEPAEQKTLNWPNRVPKDRGVHRQATAGQEKKLQCSIFKHWITIMASLWLCMNPGDCAEIGSESQCPSGCNCYESKKVIKCERQDFNMVPSMIPTSAVNLSLADNRIKELRGEPFTDLSSLKVLNLTNNQILVIRETAFANLKNLSTLDLTGNKLQRIPPISTNFLANIEDIRLRRNPIKKLISWDFIEVAGTLINLDLGELTALKEISNDALKGLNKLQTIKLDSGMPVFPNLQYLSGIREISLAGNRFDVIKSDAFKGLGRLTKIDLSNCSLRWIYFGSLKSLVSLQNINLSNNKLTTIDQEMFANNSNIQRIDLDGNNWRCDCGLKYLARWLNSRPSFCNLPMKCPRCSSPEKYRGLEVTQLVNYNKLACPAVKRPRRYDTKVGSHVNLVCPTIKPSPKTLAPKVMWTLQNGTKVGMTFRNYTVRIQVLDTGELNFSKVTLQDKGTYRCSVTSPNGTVATSTVYLNVMGKKFTSSSYISYITSTSIAKEVPTAAPRTRPRNRFGSSRAKPWTFNPFNTPWTPNIRATPVGGILNSPRGPDIDIGSSEQKVKQITKVVVGSFVGITILAAILLAILYTMRKRKEKKDQTTQNSNKSRSTRAVDTRVFLHDQINVSDQPPGSLPNQRYSGACNTPGSFRAALRRQISSADDIIENPMTLHILPPPPEEILNYEITRGRSMTTQSPPIITSQHESIFSSKQALFTIDTPDKSTPDTLYRSGILEHGGYDSLRSSKQTMPPAMKPINGLYLTDKQHITTSQRNLLTNLATSCREVALSKLRRQNSQTVPKELSTLDAKHADALVRSSSQGQMRDGRASAMAHYFQPRPQSNLSARIGFDDNTSGLVNNYDATLQYLCHNTNTGPHYWKTIEKKSKPHHKVRDEYRKAIQNSSLNLDGSQGYYDVMIDTNNAQEAHFNDAKIENSRQELESQAMDLTNIPEINEADHSSHHNSNISTNFDSNGTFQSNQIFNTEVKGHATELTPKVAPEQWNEKMQSHAISQSKIRRRHTAPIMSNQKIQHKSLSPNDVLIHFEPDGDDTSPNGEDLTIDPKMPSTNGFQYMNHTRSRTMESICQENDEKQRNPTKAKSFEAFLAHKETKI